MQILKDNGVNYIRLRIWVNPANGYNNETKVLAFAKTVKAKGLKLLIDFHYSDTWADPGHQAKPAAWASHTISQLQTLPGPASTTTLETCWQPPARVGLLAYFTGSQHGSRPRQRLGSHQSELR